MRLRRGLRQRAPFERLRPDAVPEPDRLLAGAAHDRHGDLRHGQFPGALQSADPGGRRIRDDRRDLGRAADRRLPGRHADGHLFRLWPEPVDAARALSRGARPRDARLAGAGHVRVQRPLQPAALRQHLAAPGAEAAPAGLDTRRRLGRDVAMVRPDGLRLRLPLLFRLQGRPGDDERLLGGDEAARQGHEPVPRRLPAIRRRRREPREGDGAVPRAGRIFLRPLPARRSALGDAARLHHRSDAARRHLRARSGAPRASTRGRRRARRRRWRTSSSAAM